MKRSATFCLCIILFLLWNFGAQTWGNPIRSTTSAYANALSVPDSVHLLQNVKQIASGAYHTCALIDVPPASGGVKCWGTNDYGQLGDNTTTTRNLPADVIGLSSGITVVVAGADHTCALSDTGGVKCWGLNEFGQLGDGTLQNRRIPAEVQGLSSGVLALAAGEHHTCALLATGVKCWGANDYGQLGDGTHSQHNTPLEVSGLPVNVIRIAAGGTHTCALTSSSGLKCWGNNYYGQLGDGSTVLSRTTPVDVLGLSSNVAMVSLGGSHTCAVVNSGARCWGLNSDGQVGDGSETNTNVAVNVFNLSSGVKAITTGEKHSCALLSNGSVKCWGRNANGEVGDIPNHYYITLPVEVAGFSNDVVEVAAGAHHSCARTNSGTLKCWGLNEGGQLGDGVSYLHAIPVTVTGLSSDVTDVAVGKLHSCALLNGGAKCWGDNGYLQLGNPVFGASPIPVDVAISGGTLTALAAGDKHTCALTNGGGLKCWGGNYWGQLGGGDNEYTDQIIDVIGLTTGVVTFTTRVDHTCALVAGNAKCWGHNEYGQLGSGDTTDHYVPVDVVGLQDGDVIALAGGGFHTCALTKSGGVMCWGFNQQGELGTGISTDSETTPISVTGFVSGVVAISAGMLHSCALLTSGGVKCWGDNTYGQIGDNSNKDRYTPVDVATLTSGVKAIAAGFDYTCALLNKGEIKCWGQNESGQLGDGTLINRRMPVTTVGLDGVATRIVAGSAHTCAVMNLGGIRCWGQGANGQLGNGQLAWRHIPAEVLVAGDFLTPTITSTVTPTATPTATASTPTPTGPTSTPTATEPPSGVGDAFENDDTCAKARTIASDGSIQTHTFHKNADADWVHFDSVSGKEYIIDVNIPADSLADVTLEMYPACDNLSLGGQDFAFSPGVRMQWKAETSGPINLKLSNNDADIFGAKVRYEVSVRASDESAKPGALILVAGSIKNNDTVQPNIYHVTDAVYKLFIDKGYSDDRIYYLAPDRSHSSKVDATSTRANLQAAIQEWAKSYVGSDRALTLYLMDHGAKEIFYLDKQRGESVTPDDLNNWLNNLETATPGLAVNVIIEACFSGSFITLPGSISKPGRVVLTSTDDDNLAWASQQGARFSDYLLPALARGDSLYSGYRQAQIAVQISNANQSAWIDGDGDGNPHDSAEQSVAVRRGFNFPGSLDDRWPPYITQAESPATIENGRGLLRVNVRDDDKVSHIWAVIYPPSYVAPTGGEALVQEALPTVTLLVEGNDWYRAYYDGFRESGTYRVVVYADDNQGLEARPVEMLVEVMAGGKIFLPLVAR